VKEGYAMCFIAQRYPRASMRGSRPFAGVVAALMLAVLLAPSQAWAPVPPRDCGMLQVGGKRFNIKADQIRCRTARRYARSYLEGSGKPPGYSCRDYGRETSIRFRCSKGAKVLFAIRR
jgi:hypothetical protein